MRFQKITELLHSVADNTPRLYLTLVFFISLLLLLCLYSPVIVAFVTTLSLLTSFDNGFYSGLIPGIILKLAIITLCVYVSTLFFKTPLDKPKGALLDKNKAPRLISMIDELTTQFGVNNIDHIIATDTFEVSLHFTPRFGNPYMSHITLQIGLPLLQTVSPEHLKILLARRIGQLSSSHNKLTGQTLRLYHFILAYNQAFAKSERRFMQPYAAVYKFLAKFYYSIAFYAFRKDELAADRYALDLVDDDALADCICHLTVANHFLKTRYWPHIYKLTRQSPENAFYPYANIAEAFQTHVNDEYVHSVLKDLFNRIADYQYYTPPLRSRMFNIAHESYLLPGPITTTAAKEYLGNTLKPVTSLFDKIWQTKNQKHKDSMTSDTIDRQRLDVLHKKIKQTPLSSSEAWEYASLTEKLHGYRAAIPIYKKILEKNPEHAEAMFAIGRILLSYNDDRGVYVLEQAVEIDSKLKSGASDLIGRFRARQTHSVAPSRQATV